MLVIQGPQGPGLHIRVPVVIGPSGALFLVTPSNMTEIQ